MNTFYTAKREEWRQWLADHFETENEIFLVCPTLASGEECLPYNDAVEEALCFGWIDGVLGRLDSTHFTRRFTPRRKGSGYSRPNIERLIWLDGQGLVLPKVRESVLPLISNPYVFPADIMSEINKDSLTKANFERFSAPYQRIRIAYIDDARKRPEEFRKRLANFLEKTKAGKLIIGYGGIEKYYK